MAKRMYSVTAHWDDEAKVIANHTANAILRDAGSNTKL